MSSEKLTIREMLLKLLEEYEGDEIVTYGPASYDAERGVVWIRENKFPWIDDVIEYLESNAETVWSGGYDYFAPIRMPLIAHAEGEYVYLSWVKTPIGYLWLVECDAPDYYSIRVYRRWGDAKKKAMELLKDLMDEVKEKIEESEDREVRKHYRIELSNMKKQLRELRALTKKNALLVVIPRRRVHQPLWFIKREGEEGLFGW